MKEITLQTDRATLQIYETEKTPKGCIVICPGGGYEHVSSREGAPIAKAFVKEGYLAAVLHYTVGSDLGTLPMRQLSEAICWMRDHAAEYHIEGKKLLVCGFSAGAHLAGSLGILWNYPEYFEKNADLQKHHPDGMILGYPVISSSECAHRGSFERLAGQDPEAQKRFSLECFVDQDTVPAFLWGTFEDEIVPVQNSLLLLQSLAAAGISAEYHVFPQGLHGLALATEETAQPEEGRLPDAHVARWMELCLHWLDEVMCK